MRFGWEPTLGQIGRKEGSGGFKKTLFLVLSTSANRHGSPRPMQLLLDRLKQAGVPAMFLYLFGNIPYSANSKATTKGQTLKVAFFGTPYADFPYDKLR